MTHNIITKNDKKILMIKNLNDTGNECLKLLEKYNQRLKEVDTDDEDIMMQATSIPILMQIEKIPFNITHVSYIKSTDKFIINFKQWNITKDSKKKDIIYSYLIFSENTFTQ